jgi:hypothetical protein
MRARMRICTEGRGYVEKKAKFGLCIFRKPNNSSSVKIGITTHT